MIDLRKPAAIDIVFLGRKFVLAEYTGGVFLSLALGVFVLFRSHSYWQVALGIYFVCLGLNYLPMLRYAVAIADKENARIELGNELSDKGRAMTKYRRQSIILLFPLVPLGLMAPWYQSLKKIFRRYSQ